MTEHGNKSVRSQFGTDNTENVCAFCIETGFKYKMYMYNDLLVEKL